MTAPPSPRTPALVFVGMIALGIAVLLSLPSPFIAALLLVPAFVAAAITGYLNIKWSLVLGAAASMVAVAAALAALALIAMLPRVDMTVSAGFGIVCALLSGACGALGSVMLALGRRGSTSTPTRGDLTADVRRAGAATVSAWRTGQERTAPWRRRRALRRAARAEENRLKAEERQRFQQGRENAEIHKARLQQARDYNRARSWW